eukprot:EG_transcript_39186
MNMTHDGRQQKCTEPNVRVPGQNSICSVIQSNEFEPWQPSLFAAETRSESSESEGKGCLCDADGDGLSQLTEEVERMEDACLSPGCAAAASPVPQREPPATVPAWSSPRTAPVTARAELLRTQLKEGAIAADVDFPPL